MTHPEDSELRASLGGSLRPGDSRRFFIEAMVGAMHADGHVDGRELRALRGLLERHDLFAALPSDVAQMLIDVSSDAIAFAGGAERRVPVIAGNLRWRIDRLAAFAMACEICAADEVLDEREERYLVALRIGLRLEEREHDGLLAAARAGCAMAWLEGETRRVRQHASIVAELMMVRRWRGEELTADDVHEVAAVLRRIRDLGPAAADAGAMVEEIRRRSPSWTSVDERLASLLCELPFFCDRYWTMVYLMSDQMVRGQEPWVEDPLLVRLAGAFHYSELHMQLARDDASPIAGLLRD